MEHTGDTKKGASSLGELTVTDSWLTEIFTYLSATVDVKSAFGI